MCGPFFEWCGKQDICPDELYYDSVPACKVNQGQASLREGALG